MPPPPSLSIATLVQQLEHKDLRLGSFMLHLIENKNGLITIKVTRGKDSISAAQFRTIIRPLLTHDLKTIDLSEITLETGQTAVLISFRAKPNDSSHPKRSALLPNSIFHPQPRQPDITNPEALLTGGNPFINPLHYTAH